ncbi:hypothetical protein ACFX15_006634 [Malus domestica]
MIFKIDGLFFQLHSSLLVSSVRCLHVLQGIIFTCLICSSGRCGSFFGSTAAVGDKYSRAVLEIFDKLSVIFAKLSVHVTGVHEAEKDWRLFDIWDRRFDKLPVISELASSIFELAFSNSELASSISEILSSADFL